MKLTGSDKTRNIILGLILGNAIFFIFWQGGWSHVSHSAFIAVNYLAFGLFFGLVLLFFRLMLIEKKRDENQLAQMERKCQSLLSDKELLQSEIERLSESGKQTDELLSLGSSLLNSLRAGHNGSRREKEGKHFILKAIAAHFEICCGIVYYKQKHSDEFCVEGKYAVAEDQIVEAIVPGQGACGQVLADGQPLVLNNISVDGLSAFSGLGDTKQINIYILPIFVDEAVVGVIELGAFSKLHIVDVWNRYRKELSLVLS